LVCAPSNAAIDEVASRLKDRVGHVVRLGADKAINVGVKDISLDSLIDQKLAVNNTGSDAPGDAGKQVAALRAELEAVKALRQTKEEELSDTRDDYAKNRALEEEIRKLKQQRLSLTQQIDKLKDKQRDNWRTMDALRRRFRIEILQEADVICSTLSGAGHEILEQFDGFDMIIIDEAAQSIELSSLIPLKYKCKRCVMVGGNSSQ
jgi:senataxin